jgi:hypothetical protein
MIYFLNFVKTLNKDYMFKVGLGILFIEIQTNSQSTF